MDVFPKRGISSIVLRFVRGWLQCEVGKDEMRDISMTSPVFSMTISLQYVPVILNLFKSTGHFCNWTSSYGKVKNSEFKKK